MSSTSGNATMLSVRVFMMCWYGNLWDISHALCSLYHRFLDVYWFSVPWRVQKAQKQIGILHWELQVQRFQGVSNSRRTENIQSGCRYVEARTPDTTANRWNFKEWRDSGKHWNLNDRLLIFKINHVVKIKCRNTTWLNCFLIVMCM